MKKLFIIGGIIAVLGIIALILVMLAGGSYNVLVKRSQEADKQWAQVQNVYQRRADLIPNLVATVSGAANFEKSTLTEITEARASVGKVTINANSAPASAAQLAEFEKAQGAISSALSRLLVVSERYPDLKASANFRDLQGKRAVIEVGFHSLRHTFVSLCRESNAPLSVVESIVGHSSPAMTRHYTHVGELAAGRAVALLPSVMKDATPEPEKLGRDDILRDLQATLKNMSAKNWREKKSAALTMLAAA